MNLDAVLRKLEPLMPKDVQYWRNTLPATPLLPPNTEHWLTIHILQIAHETLGDNFHNKLLLALPPEQLSKGDFHLGTILYEKEKWPFYLLSDELLQNLAIFGRSGAGKTNVAFHLLRQLVQQQIPFLFLDWKRTARHLLPQIKGNVHVYTPGRKIAPFFFNPLIPPPELELHIHTNLLLDTLGSAYTLGDGSKHLIQQALTTCYKEKQPAWPTIPDLLQTLEATQVKGRAHGWKISAVRALSTLAFADLSSPLKNHDQQDLVARLTKQHTVIELNGLNENAKQFLIPTLLLWLYSFSLSRPERERLNLVIFIEEAHHILHRRPGATGETVTERLLRQCRELGIAIVVVDQHPSLISKAALGNTYTTICLNLKDPTDIAKAAGLSLLPEDDRHHLSQLPVGHGIVKLQDRWRLPFVLKFPLITVQKGLVTNGQLEHFSQRSLNSRHSADSHPSLPHLGESEQVRRLRVSDLLQDKDGVALLHDVLQYPQDGVKQRYQRLGWSMDKGNRIKQQLVDAGLLASGFVDLGKTRKLVLRPTALANQHLGLDRPLTRESVMHTFWKQVYADRFRRLGYTVEVEAAFGTGRVDILASNASECVVVEIETGMSNVLANVQKGLQSGATKILVVATDEEALRIVETHLTKAGLLLPGRVILMLRDLPARQRTSAA